MVPDLFMIPVVLSPMNMQVMTLMTSLFRVMRGTSVREGGEIEHRREHKGIMPNSKKVRENRLDQLKIS